MILRSMSHGMAAVMQALCGLNVAGDVFGLKGRLETDRKAGKRFF